MWFFCDFFFLSQNRPRIATADFFGHRIQCRVKLNHLATALMGEMVGYADFHYMNEAKQKQPYTYQIPTPGRWQCPLFDQQSWAAQMLCWSRFFLSAKFIRLQNTPSIYKLVATIRWHMHKIVHSPMLEIRQCLQISFAICMHWQMHHSGRRRSV